MHLTQETCETVWNQDVLVLSRNVLVCDCCEQKDKAPQPLLSCCRLVPSQALSRSHCTLHRWPRDDVRFGVEDVGIPGYWGFKGALDPLHCLLLVFARGVVVCLYTICKWILNCVFCLNLKKEGFEERILQEMLLLQAQAS